MATITEIVAAWEAAGTRYAAAVAEVAAAYVEVAALDQALQNDNLPTPGPTRDAARRTFSGNPDVVRDALRHPIFARLEDTPTIADAIRDRRSRIIASVRV